MPCWYCGDRLTSETRSREHLEAIGSGGDHSLGNVVSSCQRCNQFVGTWPVEIKREFRELIRRVGWFGLPRGKNGKPSRVAVRLVLEERVKESQPPKEPRREVRIGTADYIQTHQEMPKGSGVWRFVLHLPGPPPDPSTMTIEMTSSYSAATRMVKRIASWVSAKGARVVP